jgi:hypothetical protein
MPNDQLTAAYVNKSPSIAKVYVVAQNDTTKAFANLAGELGAAYLRLFARRFPLLVEKQRIAVLKEQMNAFGQERTRMLELMKQHNLSGENDKRKWDIILGNFNFEQQRIDETIKESDDLAAVLYAKQIEFMTDCISEATKLSRLIVPALVAIRKELEMPLDEASYVTVIEESIMHQKAAVSEFIKQVQPWIVSRQEAPGDAPKPARP